MLLQPCCTAKHKIEELACHKSQHRPAFEDQQPSSYRGARARASVAAPATKQLIAVATHPGGIGGNLEVARQLEYQLVSHWTSGILTLLTRTALSGHTSTFGSVWLTPGCVQCPTSFLRKLHLFQLLFLSLTPIFSQGLCVRCHFVRCGTRPFSPACDVTASESKARLRCHICSKVCLCVCFLFCHCLTEKTER